MKDTPFKIGDVVRLRSGSPKLTITQIDPGGFLTVHHWDSNSGWLWHTFDPRTLRKCYFLDRLLG